MTEYKNNVNLLEKNIGYTFENKSLLTEALSHSSYVNECKTESIKCNERLEFLGDSILSQIVSEYLFFEYRDFDEGGLSAVRREIVDSESLSAFAKSIDLGSFLYLGRGEENLGGRERRSILEDAFEALVAAIYIDGGRDAARNFVLPFAMGVAEKICGQKKISDSKSKLQEIVQRGGGAAPVYVITKESGPDHNKHFECEVLVENNVMGKGSGGSKKEAEKAAAEEALLYFGDVL